MPVRRYMRRIFQEQRKGSNKRSNERNYQEGVRGASRKRAISRVSSKLPF